MCDMIQDDCIKNELSLDEDDGPIPELVDDQESDDEETDSSMPELVHLDAIEDDEEVLGPIRLVSREVLDNHTECCIIRLPQGLPVYLCSRKKYNDLWGAGQRGTSRLPSLQTGEPTAEWEATAEIQKQETLLSKKNGDPEAGSSNCAAAKMETN